jgi:hypothetical protein
MTDARIVPLIQYHEIRYSGPASARRVKLDAQCGATQFFANIDLEETPADLMRSGQTSKLFQALCIKFAD